MCYTFQKDTVDSVRLIQSASGILTVQHLFVSFGGRGEENQPSDLPISPSSFRRHSLFPKFGISTIYLILQKNMTSFRFFFYFFFYNDKFPSLLLLPTPQPSVEASKSFGVFFFFLCFPKLSGEFSSGSLHFLPSFRPSVPSTVSDGMVAVADVGLLGGQHCEGARSVKEKVKTYNREL